MRKLALSLATLAVSALSLPALVSAAPPPEGAGLPLVVEPSPIVAPKTTVGYNGQALQVEILNPGEEAQIEKVMLTGPEAGEFFVDGSNCGALPELQKCQFFFGLKPGSVGLKQATMEIIFAGIRAPETFPVSGEAFEPEFSFDVGSYDYGLQRVDGENTSHDFAVTNSGEAPAQPNSIQIVGPGAAAFFTGSGNCNFTLEPGQSCFVSVSFNPHQEGKVEAALNLIANGNIAGSVQLSGNGGRANVEAESPVSFGAAAVGTEGAVRTITLHNSGNLPAGFFISLIAGGDSAGFRLLDENCTFVELNPGSGCTAHVRFTPQSPGPQSARLAFFGDGDDGRMVELEGIGTAATGSGGSARVAPRASLTPADQDFGKIRKGRAGRARTFAIRNDGTVALSLDRAAIVGANLDQFRLTGDECSGETLAPGGECRLRARFTPRTAGAKTATLRVWSGATSFQAQLSGHGAKPKPKQAKKQRRR